MHLTSLLCEQHEFYLPPLSHPKLKTANWILIFVLFSLFFFSVNTVNPEGSFLSKYRIVLDLLPSLQYPNKTKQAQPRAVKPWDNNPRVRRLLTAQGSPGLSRLQNHKETLIKQSLLCFSAVSTWQSPCCIWFHWGGREPLRNGLETIQSGSIHPLYILPRSIQCDVVKII